MKRKIMHESFFYLSYWFSQDYCNVKNKISNQYKYSDYKIVVKFGVKNANRCR